MQMQKNALKNSGSKTDRDVESLIGIERIVYNKNDIKMLYEINKTTKLLQILQMGIHKAKK